MSNAAIEYLADKVYRNHMLSKIPFPPDHFNEIVRSLKQEFKKKIKVISRDGVDIFITTDNRKKWIDRQYE